MNTVTGTDQKENRMPPRDNPAFEPIKDEPGLPRVLIIGDSISVGYTLPARKLLEGKANLHRPLTNCGPTQRGIEEIENWLGEGSWDVIHFNWGLHDIVYMMENGERADPPRGQHQVLVDQYAQNLNTLVKRLKETAAKLVWCATTPVPQGASNRKPGDEVEYNAIAQKVMDSHGVPTNDLYTYALERLHDIQLPANVHFTTEGSATLAEPVARHILDLLGLQPACLTDSRSDARQGLPAEQSAQAGRARPASGACNPLLGEVPAGRGGYQRDQAGRSDNIASRACRFEVSVEQSEKDDLFLAEISTPLSFNRFSPFSRNR